VQGKSEVHIDQCFWLGILYLSKNKDCVGSTDFYRNKATKSDTAPLNIEQLRNMGFNNHQEFWDDLKANGQNVDQWQLTSHIPMKYNRLVLFRPWIFHNAGPGFGDSVENGRVIYPLFYNNQ
jgi:superoxide dismutase